MRQSRLRVFLSLLLVMTATVATWSATQTFNVVYVGRTTSQGAGYTADLNQSIQYYYVQGYYTVSITSYTQSDLIVTGTYANYTSDRNTYGPLLVNYIHPYDVEGYIAAVTVSGTTITITYSPKTITYRVFWDKEFITGGGYTVKNKDVLNGTITSGDNADYLVITATGNVSPSGITNSNVANYITPNAVSGYTTGLYVRENEKQLGYEGTIYVNYTTTETPTVTTDGIYDYSNIYTRETGSVVKLPDDECAISLHLTGTQITEEKEYYRYRINDNYYDLEEDGYYRNNDYTNQYPLNESGSRLNGNTTQGTDPDNDGYGTTATWTYKSSGDWENYETLTAGTVYCKKYIYEFKHEVGISTVENAVIPLKEPKTLADGSTSAERKVTAIQKWGFCYKQDDVEIVDNCEVNDNGTVNKNNVIGHPRLIDDHSNLHLKKVTFEKDANGQSNLESIGDYAFMSCKNLTDVDIPFSVKYMGQGIFEMDTKLKNVNFQTGKITLDGQEYNEGVQFSTVRMFTFWMCTAMETLVLPDGITDIEGQTSGAAMQYMTSLINLSLPNTLKRIGPHFLCSASSLKTLTIPVSVEYIDGASFHGCESLESVYVLGPAANLQGEFAEGNEGSSSSTFSANTTHCKNAVNNCTFYTTQDNYAGYVNDDVWGRINNDGVYEPSNGQFGNKLVVIPDDKRWLIPNVWVTALFPHGVEGYKTKFGEETLVAVMDPEVKPTYTMASDPKTNKQIKIYDIEFKLLEGDDIPKDTPVMIKPGKEVEHVFYTGADQNEQWWKTNSTIDFTTEVEAVDGAKIRMKGRYLSHQLQPYDFYFMYQKKTTDEETGKVNYDKDEVAKFYRVEEQSEAPMIRACRCWWQVFYDDMKSDGTATTKSNVFRPDPTGISTVDDNVMVRVSIYDINGRKLNMEESQLPQGLYIINGKKTIKR